MGSIRFGRTAKKTYVNERNYSPVAWELYLACSILKHEFYMRLNISVQCTPFMLRGHGSYFLKSATHGGIRYQLSADILILHLSADTR